MAENEETPSAIVVDDTGRLRVLDPETSSHSRLLAQSCTVFQSKIQQFQNVTLLNEPLFQNVCIT